MNILIVIILLLSSTICLASNKITCSIDSKTQDDFMKVKCKTSSGEIVKGFTPAISKIDKIKSKDGEVISLDHSSLFDLYTGSYLNGDRVIKAGSFDTFQVNESDFVLYEDSKGKELAWGCNWKQKTIEMVKSSNCDICFGEISCSYGNGPFEASAYCPSVKSSNSRVCPSASECFSNKDFKVTRYKEKESIIVPSGNHQRSGGASAISE